MSTVHETAQMLTPHQWGVFALVFVGWVLTVGGRRHRRHHPSRSRRRAYRPGQRYSTDPQRDFSADQRRQMLARDHGCCCYCGVPVHYEAKCQWIDGCNTCFEADHYIPHSKGGPTTLANGRTSCRYHNRLKSDRMPDEFLAGAQR